MNRYEQRDSVLKKMGFPSYESYRRSNLWKRIRARLLKGCPICPCGNEATEIHHRTYKRRYMEGRGRITKFLVPICRLCHAWIEFDDGYKTSLGKANAKLDQIRENAEAKGIRVPSKYRMYKKKCRKLPASGVNATDAMSRDRPIAR